MHGKKHRGSWTLSTSAVFHFTFTNTNQARTGWNSNKRTRFSLFFCFTVLLFVVCGGTYNDNNNNNVYCVSWVQRVMYCNHRKNPRIIIIIRIFRSYISCIIIIIIIPQFAFSLIFFFVFTVRTILFYFYLFWFLSTISQSDAQCIVHGLCVRVCCHIALKWKLAANKLVKVCSWCAFSRNLSKKKEESGEKTECRNQ